MTACSTLGERLGEDLAATAPSAARFLLIEVPGPWRGRNAVTTGDLDERVARALLARADEAGVKVQAIRRSSRRAAPGPRTCFLASTGRDGAWLERFQLPDAASVLELDLTAGPRSTWDEPLYLVCTHGKRDACCARRGRPLARALRARRPSETWEIGHIGGHRFAATFLAFPHGLAFGRVPAAEGPRVVTALERGEIALEFLRGRAGDSWAAQAADVLVRRRLDLPGVHDLAIEGVEAGDDGAASVAGPDPAVVAGHDRALVALRTAGGARLRATISRTQAEPRPISCGDEAEPVFAHSLADLTALDRAA